MTHVSDLKGTGGSNWRAAFIERQDLIGKLRKKAAKRGLGYQTMLKVIVRESRR